MFHEQELESLISFASAFDIHRQVAIDWFHEKKRFARQKELWKQFQDAFQQYFTAHVSHYNALNYYQEFMKPKEESKKRSRSEIGDEMDEIIRQVRKSMSSSASSASLASLCDDNLSTLSSNMIMYGNLDGCDGCEDLTVTHELLTEWNAEDDANKKEEYHCSSVVAALGDNSADDSVDNSADNSGDNSADDSGDNSADDSGDNSADDSEEEGDEQGGDEQGGDEQGGDEQGGDEQGGDEQGGDEQGDHDIFSTATKQLPMHVSYVDEEEEEEELDEDEDDYDEKETWHSDYAKVELPYSGQIDRGVCQALTKGKGLYNQCRNPLAKQSAKKQQMDEHHPEWKHKLCNPCFQKFKDSRGLGFVEDRATFLAGKNKTPKSFKDYLETEFRGTVLPSRLTEFFNTHEDTKRFFYNHALHFSKPKQQPLDSDSDEEDEEEEDD